MPADLQADNRPPRTWGWMLALVAATILTYSSVWRAGFIWNDSDYVTNPELRSAGGLLRIWFEVGATEQYYPLLHSWFWVQQKLWGDAPLGYHLVAVLLHAANAVVLWLVLRRLAVRGALLAAFLFALHPVCVESVAWIAEQKNTLSTLFYLLAALAYLRFDAGRRPRDYAIASAWFACALLSKSLTATLVGALLVVFWWKRGRLEWRRDFAPLAPWFVAGAAVGLFTGWVEKTVLRAEGADFALTFADRVLVAGRIVWFYLGKLVWPADLIFIYPRWEIDARAAGWAWLWPLSLLALVAGLWLLRKRTRAPLAALLFFLGSVFPTSGFFNVYGFRFSYVADHWQYLPCIGALVLAAAALLAFLAALSWRQGGLYRDIVTFYERTIAANPGCWMAHSNLGGIHAEAGRWRDAMRHYELGLALKPASFELNHNMGLAYVATQRPSLAIPYFMRAIELEPRSYASYHNLGAIFRQAGRHEEAIAWFLRAIGARPRYVPARNGLGLSLLDLQRTQEAVVVFQEALAFAPDDPETHNNLGIAFTNLARPAEAEAELRRVLELNPAHAAAHDNLGNLYRRVGRLPEAIAAYEHAHALNPASPVTLVNLTLALADARRFPEAIAYGERAVQVAPGIGETHFNLAVALLGAGRIPEARERYGIARKLKPSLPLIPPLEPAK